MPEPLATNRFHTELDESGLTRFGKSYLLSEAKELIRFAGGSLIPDGGFGYLDTYGRVDQTKPREAYVQCRMIQVFGLGHLIGLGDYSSQVRHGVASLNELFFDRTHGGFFNAIDLQDNSTSHSKLGYDQAFVLLAAMTAKSVGVAGAEILLERGTAAIDTYFWDPQAGMMNNHWDNSFTQLSPYRGINVNMHAVEAFIAAYDVTKDKTYLERALSITKRAIDGFARSNQWLLPEHFSANWEIEKEFNRENPADQFLPYGVTIGHLFEWSRLTLQLGLYFEGEPGYEWILEGARALYEVGKSDGWNADGTPGFIYTMDWDRKPVVRSRMFWVAAEAVMTAFTLWKVTGEDRYLRDYDNWWGYIDKYVIDKQHGAWFSELDPNQQVVETTWPGKPDIYHAFNACLLPLLPFVPSFVGAALQLQKPEKGSS